MQKQSKYRHRDLRLRAVCLVVLGLIAAIGAQAAPPKTKKGDGAESRGVTQMKGGDGVFGTVYTLQSGINFQILSAKYSLEPFNDYNGTMARPDEKLVVITYAIKNSGTGDWDGGGREFTLVDENDQNYTASNTRLASNGSKEFYGKLKPGQGLGQDPTANALQCAIVVPGKAKIKRIILNEGRKNVASEKIIRYNVAGYPGGGPKNVIAPLPKYAADATDPSGAVALDPAPIIAGKAYPDGYFSLRFDGLTFSNDETVGGDKPEDGKRYAIATFTAKNVFLKKMSTFELTPQLEDMVLRDTDGEKYHAVRDSGLRKAKRDDSLGSEETDVGEEIKYRVFFAIPKDATPKTLTFGKNTYGHTYVIDLSSAAGQASAQ